MKKITKDISNKVIDNKDLLKGGFDIIEPKLLAVRYELNKKTKEITNSDYFIKHNIPFQNNYFVYHGINSTNIINFTITS